MCRWFGGWDARLHAAVGAPSPETGADVRIGPQPTRRRHTRSHLWTPLDPSQRALPRRHGSRGPQLRCPPPHRHTPSPHSRTPHLDAKGPARDVVEDEGHQRQQAQRLGAAAVAAAAVAAAVAAHGVALRLCAGGGRAQSGCCLWKGGGHAVAAACPAGGHPPAQQQPTPAEPPLAPAPTSRRAGDRALVGLPRRLPLPSSSPSSIVATPGWREEPPKDELPACALWWWRASGEEKAPSRSLSGVLPPASLSSTSLPVLDTLRRMGSSAEGLRY